MTRWLPRSLFSRMVLILVTGLVLAQAASLAIYWRDRDEFMQRALGMRSVQRIADILRLLDSTAPEERKRAPIALMIVVRRSTHSSSTSRARLLVKSCIPSCSEPWMTACRSSSAW